MARPRLKKSLMDQIAAMPEEYLECAQANLQHSWALAALDAVALGTERWMWCKRCKMNKFVIISRDGKVVRSTYDAPPGYGIQNAGPRTTEVNQALRLEGMLRAMTTMDFEPAPRPRSRDKEE